MWSTLALAAALCVAPAQPAGLQLSNVRMTIGELGPARPDNKVLPGDILFVGFDIDGITVDPNGQAKYSMAMEVLDKAGKPIFKQNPRDLDDFVPLRGNKLPARAFVTVGLDQEAGEYTCKVTVTDSASKASNSLTTKFQVLKRDFGVVSVYTSYDGGGAISAPTTGFVGQSLFIQFAVASFQRDPKTKQPNVELEYNVLDEKGQPLLAQPKKHTVDSGVEADKGAFPFGFPLFMNRPGKFTARIIARDKVANKESKYELPVTVLPAN
jgi:hypothetical protein